MEDQVTRLVDKAYNLYLDLPPSQRLIIAIGGMPGSGKTTMAKSLVSAINARHASSHSPTTANPIAALLPMDGYHLTRVALSALPDPAPAFKRRGALYTFNAPAYLSMIRQLREPITPESRTIEAPSFDHAVKDPVEGDIKIGTGVKVVVVEGNYVALDDTASDSEGEEKGKKGPWLQAAELCDEVWFVECDEKVAKERLVKRHVASGIEGDEESAARRAEENDLVNGREIVRRRWKGVREVVVSRGDGGWVERVEGGGS